MEKNNKIPPFIICPTPELARQVLEKIERESDLRWVGREKEKPTKFIPKYSYYPEIVISTTDDCLSYDDIERFTEQGITNFTKAEDFLSDNDRGIYINRLINNYMTDKTWGNLQEGWVLEHSRDEFEILAIRGRVIDLSSSNDFNLAGGRYTKEELINGGFKIKGASEDKPSIDDVIEILDKAHYHACDSDAQEAIMPAIEMLKKLK